MERIVQIIPSGPDHRAAFTRSESSDEVEFRPLVCWALAEDEGGYRRVVGMVEVGSQVVLVDTDDNFWCYDLTAGKIDGSVAAEDKKGAEH